MTTATAPPPDDRPTDLDEIHRLTRQVYREYCDGYSLPEALRRVIAQAEPATLNRLADQARNLRALVNLERTRRQLEDFEKGIH